ncbi:hypothetical protein [Trichothermofontia sp.]
MKRLANSVYGLGLSLCASLGLLSIGGPAANALPGQLNEEVEAWIQAHPTLRPASGEKLLVRKSNTPAQRFVFQASVFPPGRVAPVDSRGIIRTERIQLFDMVNGVNRNRFEESLRAIYGLDIYQDYAQAEPVFSYPTPYDVREARDRQTPLQMALQGEIRSGNRFGYWLEIAQPADGKAYSGHLVVFAKEYLDKLETELRNR